MEAMTVMIKDQVKSKQYSKAQAETMRATQKTDELLYSIFPRHIADTLKSGGTQKDIPRGITRATIRNDTQDNAMHLHDI
jgi:hypothetical protein